MSVKQNKKYIYVNIVPNSEKYAIYLDGMRKSQALAMFP